MSVAPNEANIEVTDYVSVVRRRWRWVALGLIIGIQLAVAGLVLIPKTYTSTASVMVQSTGDDGAVANGRTSTPINLDTEAQVVKSTVVSQRALESMTDPGESAARDLAKHVLVTVPANTSVLNIAFSAPTAKGAQAGAKAFADAYLINRAAAAKARVDGQTKVLTTRIDALGDRLKESSVSISKLAAGSPEREYEVSQRALIVDQIAALNTQLVSLSSGDLQAGYVISDPQVPQQPSAPNVKLIGLSGVMVGLLIGLLAAVSRDRLDKRVRDARDLERLGLETLVSHVDVPAVGSFGPTGATGQRAETMRQLRNSLLARLPGERGTVLVVGTAPDQTGTAVATDLAITMARSGIRVVLISANSVADGVAETFGHPEQKGLADVLHRRAAIDDVARKVEGIVGLEVVTSGADSSLYSELLQSDKVRTVLDALQSRAGIVVVDVAPASVNADAQSIATLCDGVLLVATKLVSSKPQLIDAVDQMRRVSAPLLGAVAASVTRTTNGAAVSNRASADESRPPAPSTDASVQSSRDAKQRTGPRADDSTAQGERPAPAKSRPSKPAAVKRPADYELADKGRGKQRNPGR